MSSIFAFAVAIPTIVIIVIYQCCKQSYSDPFTALIMSFIVGAEVSIVLWLSMTYDILLSSASIAIFIFLRINYSFAESEYMGLTPFEDAKPVKREQFQSYLEYQIAEKKYYEILHRNSYRQKIKSEFERAEKIQKNMPIIWGIVSMCVCADFSLHYMDYKITFDAFLPAFFPLFATAACEIMRKRK